MMSSGKKSIFTKSITRGELPAFERRGVLAQEVRGREVLVIVFHQAKIDFETCNGVAAEVPLVLLELRPGISDTVVLGSISMDRDRRVELLDVLMLERKSCRMKPWKERIDILEKIREKFPVRMKEKVIMAKVLQRGFLEAFDRIENEGGVGLVLRESNKASTMICDRR